MLRGAHSYTKECRDLGIRTMSSPKTYDILHNVAIVKLCVPESQRLTSVSVLPSWRANSFCVMFLFSKMSYIRLAIATDISIRIFISGETEVRISSIILLVFISQSINCVSRHVPTTVTIKHKKPLLLGERFLVDVIIFLSISN